MLQLAEASIRGHNPVTEIISDLNAAQVGFWLATGQLSRASLWSQGFSKTIHPEDVFSIPRETDEITQARVSLAEGKPEIALQSLERLAAAAERGGRMGYLIEIRKLQALALQARNGHQQALDMLQKSLALAEPEGYIRIFVDEGEPMRAMLLAYVQAGSYGNTAYAKKLLAVFTGPVPAAPSKAPSSNLVEPLTAREIEVLQAMAEGYSNRQIAEKLILAEGTVKYYVHAVLEKLGVHNRTQALLEAKKLKII